LSSGTGVRGRVNQLIRATVVASVILGSGLLASEQSAVASTNPATLPSSGPVCPGVGRIVSLHPGATGSVAATRAQVDAIEVQIAAEQICIMNLSEQYDQASYRLQQVDGALASTQKNLREATDAKATSLSQLRNAAVNAYMYDAPLQQITNFFSELTPTGSLEAAYTADALGNVTQDLQAMQAAQKHFSAVQALLISERNRAAEETAGARHAESEATAVTNASRALLSQVKGKLARQVAAQAALQAERDAAAVASAATAREKAAEALKAEEAAQVAQSLGGGGSATQAANKAAKGAGDQSQSPPKHPTGSAQGEIAVHAAESFLGVPYVWGGASRSGVDCSGLVMLAWAAAGVNLVHSAALQAQMSTPVPLTQLQPGDLLFYDFGGTGIDHVIMYVGSGPYGSNTIIQAAHTGTVVSFDPIWFEGLVGAGRP
jgi:cell wall-associated NlpC family hydrolase